MIMAIIQANFVQLYILLQEQSAAIEMADKLRENGKIYAVVAIILILFIGFLLYVISLDRKISKLEKTQINE